MTTIKSTKGKSLREAGFPAKVKKSAGKQRQQKQEERREHILKLQILIKTWKIFKTLEGR